MARLWMGRELHPSGWWADEAPGAPWEGSARGTTADSGVLRMSFLARARRLLTPLLPARIRRDAARAICRL